MARNFQVAVTHRINELPWKKEQEHESKDFRHVLTHVHPHLKSTPIPEIASQLLCFLRPLCLHDKKQFDLGDTNALFRGSLIKRYALGTPSGYTKIPFFYRSHRANFGDSSITTREVVDKLAQGPIEIDFRAVFSDQNQVLPTLSESLISQGFNLIQNLPQGITFQGEKYSVKITSQPIGSDDYPRLLYNVIFLDGTGQILNIDITDLPDEALYWRELRLSWKAGMFELDSTAEAEIGEKKIIVTVKKSLRDYSRYQNVRIARNVYYSDIIGHGLRELSSLLFWPKRNKKGRYDLNYLIYQLGRGEIRRPDSRIERSRFLLLNSQELTLLRKRNSSLISDFLLYLTYDPFLFPILLYESQLIEFIPLGDYIQTRKDLNALITYMIEEFVSKKNVQQNLSVPLASSLYKKLVLESKDCDLRQTGPFMLVRALNRLFQERNNDATREEISKMIDQTLEEAVSLFSPLLLAKE